MGPGDSIHTGRVFISHASEDRAVAEAICAALESAGLPCWVAPRDIEPGRDWAGEIMAGLDACRLVVLVVSANAQASPQVTRELERADARKLPVVPFRIDGVELTGRWEYFLSGVHWLDAQQGAREAHLQELTEVVRRALAAAPRRPSRRLPRIGALLAGRSLRWVGVAALVLAVLGLHQIPRPVDVTLHATTERVAFSLEGAGAIEVIRSLPVASLRLRGLPAIRLAAAEVRQAGKTLVRGSGDQPVILQAQLREAALTLRGTDGLRLQALTLAGGTRVTLVADRAGQLIVEAGEARGARIVVGVLGELSLEATDLILVGPGGQVVPFAAPGPSHVLEATPLSRTLIFEPEAEGPFALVLDVSDAMARSARTETGSLPLPVAPRLKVASLDFTRTERGRELPALRRLWVEPLGDEKNPLGAVYLDVPAAAIFTLQKVGLTEDALACELTGRPPLLQVGKDLPGEDLVPSLLQYLAGHVVFRTFCRLVGLC
jgi:hypothetical protein